MSKRPGTDPEDAPAKRLKSLGPWERHLQGFYKFMTKDMRKDRLSHEYTGDLFNTQHKCTITYGPKPGQWLLEFQQKTDAELAVEISLSLVKDFVEFGLENVYYNKDKNDDAQDVKYMSVSQAVANGLGLAYVFAKNTKRSKIKFLVTDLAHVVPDTKEGHESHLMWMHVLHMLRTQSFFGELDMKYKSLKRSIYDLDVDLPGWEMTQKTYKVNTYRYMDPTDLKTRLPLEDFKFGSETDARGAIRAACELWDDRTTRKLKLREKQDLAQVVLQAWDNQLSNRPSLKKRLPSGIWQTLDIVYEQVPSKKNPKLDETLFTTANGTAYQKGWMRLRF